MMELLMPLAVFGSFVLIVGHVTRLLSNISLNNTLREALRSHPPSVPLLAQRLDSRQPWADALVGWIFIAFAAGLVLLALFEPGDERRDIFQAAVVPALVGVVVLGFVRWAKREGVAPVRPASSSAPGLSPPSPHIDTGMQPTPTPRRRTVRKPA